MLQIYLAIIDDENDKSRFEELYERYAKLMHYVAKEILSDDRLAEEAVQEAFFRIARNFHKVGAVKNRETKNFAALITRRIALSMAETESRHGRASEAVSEGAAADAGSMTTTGEGFENAEYKALVEAILSLPEIYRNVLYLQGVYEYTLKETAGLLGITVDTAKKRTQRGRKMLREKAAALLKSIYITARKMPKPSTPFLPYINCCILYKKLRILLFIAFLLSAGTVFA